MNSGCKPTLPPLKPLDPEVEIEARTLENGIREIQFNSWTGMRDAYDYHDAFRHACPMWAWRRGYIEMVYADICSFSS